MTNNKTYRAAVYLRLSREDGDVADGGKQVSNSIANQKELVMDYILSPTLRSRSYPPIRMTASVALISRDRNSSGCSLISEQQWSNSGTPLMEKRNELSRSCIICSQREPKAWPSMLMEDEVSSNSLLKRVTKHYIVMIERKVAD
jgi:hypothetical protein